MTVLYIFNTNNEIQKSKIKLLLRMGCCFLFLVCLYICVCECLLQTTLRECLRAGLPLGFLSTAPPLVLVSAVLGTLAVWIPNQKNKNFRPGNPTPICGEESGQGLEMHILAHNCESRNIHSKI